MKFSTGAALAVVAALTAVLHAEGPREEALLMSDYSGAHPDQFTIQYDRVRLLVHQAQLEASSQLGLLQYSQGFQFPMRIRFADGAPNGIENILAYVQLMRGPNGFMQELVVNLDATASMSLDFDQIFTHEMTHAVMNDAVGAEASMRIPHWVQEGLAQYVSGEGPMRVTRAAEHLRRYETAELLYPLDGPYSGRGYPQYYLAIAYIYDHYGSTSVQTFVRDLIAGKSTADSIEDSLGVKYDRYQSDLREYSKRAFEDKAIPGS